MSSPYFQFMHKWNREHGYNSFYGSNKRAFLGAWRAEKEKDDNTVTPQPRLERASMEAEDINRAEPFAERQQRIAAKSTNVKSAKKMKDKKILTNEEKGDIMYNIWSLLHKYHVAHDNISFYDWTGKNDRSGSWSKSRTGRNLASIYLEELAPIEEILDDLRDKDIIGNYEENAGEEYVYVDNSEITKPRVLPSKDDILKQTEKWGIKLKKLIEKLK
jgi:hypothetical protein